MTRRLRGLRDWLAKGPQGDGLAALLLLVLCAVGTRWTWGRLYDPLYDQGWYMQVAARVAAGDVLYRDVIWMYGPLPVYILAALFRWLGTQIAALWLLQHGLAVLGCLLTYRVARFLLPGPLALLGTVAVFLGGWWGGFVSYALAYTGAVPLGAVLGLVFLLCLLSYLRSGRLAWLIGAGLTTGGALLTKPEFALACLGTGWLFLAAIALFPAGLGIDRARAWQALGLYLLSALLVAGAGYGLMVSHAGWRYVWTGVRGYDQGRILLQVWPPWGAPRSWAAILSGLGGYLLLALALVGVMGVLRKGGRSLAGLAGLGLALLALPWVGLYLASPGWLASVVASRFQLLQAWIELAWAPATTLMTLAFFALAIGWLRAYRRQQVIDRVAWYGAALVVYSALPPARTYFHPLRTFHFQHLDTWFPVLAYSALCLIPRFVEQRWQARVRRACAPMLVALIFLVYGLAGLAWNLVFLSRLNAELVTPRGAALVLSEPGGRQPWRETLQTIIARTHAEDSIAVLGHAQGLYFLSGRRNPLRQDTILPGMGSSPEEVADILRRLESDPPGMIVVPRGVETGRGWFWELDVGRDAYENLRPVWDYVGDRYRLCMVLGGQEQGYAIYEPQDKPESCR